MYENLKQVKWNKEELGFNIDGMQEYYVRVQAVGIRCMVFLFWYIVLFVVRRSRDLRKKEAS